MLQALQKSGQARVAANEASDLAAQGLDFIDTILAELGKFT